MKINIYTSDDKAGSNLSEDLRGITTFDAPHSGQHRVERIIDIRVGYDGGLAVLVEPLVPEPSPVAEPESVEDIPF